MDLSSEKVIYHIQALIMFLNISKDAKTLTQEFVEKALESSTLLLKNAYKDPEHVVSQLNQLIDEMNAELTAPYPILMTDSLENIVKAEIVAFEHYLNQELKANHLSINEEAPLFNDSLYLWEKVGVSLSPREGISQFAAIINKLNQLLPDDQKYPFPDENQY